MKRTIEFCDFTDSFIKAGRKDRFSYRGLLALYNYLVDFEQDTGSEIELDVIASCCEFSEYENFKELQNNYDMSSMDELENSTIVIHIPGSESFIIQDF